MVKKVHHTPAAHLGLLRRVEAHGMRMGRSGNKNWFYVGTGLWTLRTVRRLAERREEILIHEKLKPGERIIISNARPTLDEPPAPAPPKGRRARKAQRKADEQAARRAAKQARSRKARKARKAEEKAAAKQAKRASRRPAPASEAQAVD